MSEDTDKAVTRARRAVSAGQYRPTAVWAHGQWLEPDEERGVLVVHPTLAQACHERATRGRR